MKDFAIVGSGVSGGRIAWELTQAGAKCVLIEAGKNHFAKTYPNNELDYSSQLFWGGGLELSDDGKLGFLRAKCVGGTSIVNQALLDEFDDNAWDDWRSISGINFFKSESFSKYYESIFKEVPHSQIPEKHYNRNSKIFIQAFENLKYGWKPLVRAQTDCKLDHGTDCIVCLGGCPRESKQSSAVTGIRWALQKGLELESSFEVSKINIEKDRVTVYGEQNGNKKEIAAANVFLAAGALGNSSILIRSGLKKKLPGLGTRFTCHPQFMTYALFEEPVNSHKGAFQCVKSYDTKLREKGVKLENVFAPPIGTAMLLPGYGKKHHSLMKKYKYMASMEVALRDDACGTIAVTNSGKIVLKKKLTYGDWKKAKFGLELVKDFFQSVGAKEIIPCMQGFGLHLMGGCPIGTDSSKFVVDPEFKLHGHSNVWIADSSIFPSAPGINPSFTIMALSKMAAEKASKR
jgi:choline dehydrogenase-like flavoprotein